MVAQLDRGRAVSFVVERARGHLVALRPQSKRRARLNVIKHLLSLIPYQDLTPEPIDLPPREPDRGYVRPPIDDQSFIPEPY